MPRKKIRQGAVVAENCFRLLRLTHEIQTDVKVLKVVVDEVDVLRLCRSLGMAVSDEGDRGSMHTFEFGMFDPSKYDADVARFLRENLAVGSGVRDEENEAADSDLEIGCLFGKREEVKAELKKMGVWSREYEEGLSVQGQGVYCAKQNNKGKQGRSQFVVFTWLSADLFEPEGIRDTPAYILRFLVSLSSSITCCLSQEDFQHIRNEVHDASENPSPQWDSCSIAFQVHKQEEQSDNICCEKQTKSSVPHSGPIKNVSFVGGAFSAVAVKNAVSSTTQWVTECSFMPSSELAEWLMGKYEQRSVQLPHGKLRPLEACDNAGLLLAIRSSNNSSAMDMAFQRYGHLLERLQEFEVISELDQQTLARLTIPEILQENMQLLYDSFAHDPSKLESLVNAIANGSPSIQSLKAGNASQGRLRSLVGAIKSLWRTEEKLRFAFGRSMEPHQTKLQKIWLTSVECVLTKLQSAIRGQRLWQSGDDRHTQFEQEEEQIKDKAYGTIRKLLLKADDAALSVKISRLSFTADNSAVNIKWSEEVVKDPSEVLQIYQLSSTNPVQVVLLGDMEFEPGAELLELTTVKTGMVIAVFVYEGKTTVRRFQFPLSESTEELEVEESDVRTFPRECSLCSIRPSDRRVAFTFAAAANRLGNAVFCRFNESFTSIGAMRTVNLDTTFRLTGPFADILLTERSLCIMDKNGHLQSFDLVLGCTTINDRKQLRLDCISSEDHRHLPSVVLLEGVDFANIAVGCMDDALYVVNGDKGVVYASELSVTVRTEAYRIQQSGFGGKSRRPTSLKANSETTGDTESWLRQPRTCTRERSHRNKQILFLQLDAGSTPSKQASLRVRPEQKDNQHDVLQIRPMRRVVMTVIAFVPVQICRAQDNMLRLLHNGEDMATSSRDNCSSDSSEPDGSEATEIAQAIRFGLLSPLLESWNGRCVVVTSMGKQSTGKSYFLNHLAGTSFAISGSRCTDGAWMSLRLVSANVLLIVLDFEGLGSFERSEQEDIFLSVLNASVSLFTVFRMESRFDKDIDGLFSRFQKGVQLIKNDLRLFRGLLYMSVKDVNSNDRCGVYSELGAKLNAIFMSSREQNFLTEMYAGNLRISCAPPFGTVEYYQSLEKDTTANLLTIVAPLEKSGQGFVTGCHVSRSLIADPKIPSHLKEDVVRVGSREKIVITSEEVFQAYPSLVERWKALNDSITLDEIDDTFFDLGFDVSALVDRKSGLIKKALNTLFRQFLRLQGSEYGKSRLTTVHQSKFDIYVIYIAPTQDESSELASQYPQ
ncbi:unnamed protein product [Phytophthora fragariaefolia]|uniref:Unnamed protein product n=1 Tax=Phytophthora fragariaefolia TaxID=1490495 RepID=A0A9W6Y399_9STRA|nr:unnamed protein product [Phytophthora fragariaefolia]